MGPIAADDPRSLRVDVTCGKEVIRPTVGIKCSPDWTMADVLARALSFRDRRQRSEEDVLELLKLPCDTVLKDKDSVELCSVAQDETVAGAELFGQYAHVAFDIAIPEVRQFPLHANRPIRLTLFSPMRLRLPAQARSFLLRWPATVALPSTRCDELSE